MRSAVNLSFVVVVVVVVVAGAALGAGCAPTGTSPPLPQANACRVALACYFGPDDAHDLGSLPGFQGLTDHDLFVDTYGPNGTCWTDDLALARACEDRCRALLWQDCNFSWRGEGAAPFCSVIGDHEPVDVCGDDFREACQRATRDDGQAEQSECPTGGGDRADSFCSLAGEPDAKGVVRGCCSINDRPVAAGTCPYDYDFDADGNLALTAGQ